MGVTLSASSAREPSPVEQGCADAGIILAAGGDQSLRPAAQALALHNEERARLGVPPLAWSCTLERGAALWAEALVRRGALEHASGSARDGSGENLWMGTAGRFPVERMVGRFIEEKHLYHHDRFPEISRTGNWADVGHYSQVVWRDTRELGCALARGTASDVLVCRYRPAGNVRGRMAY
jgi:hypothetical protein